MSVYCTGCGKEIPAVANARFCRFCGMEAPEVTLKEVAGNGIGFPEPDGWFCRTCGVRNFSGGTWCMACGTWFFDKLPAGGIQYCPRCGSKNGSASRLCFNCRFDLSAWAAMEGEAVRSFGLPFSYVMKFPGRKDGPGKYNIYRFINGEELTIGRRKGNTILLPCMWVSGKHLSMNAATGIVADLDSTNHTYVDFSSEPVNVVELSEVSRIHIAGTHTFQVTTKGGVTVLRLMTVRRSDECRACRELATCKEMEGLYWVWVHGDGYVLIRLEDGRLSFLGEQQYRYLRFDFREGYTYVTDRELAIGERLLFRERNFFEEKYGIVVTEGVDLHANIEGR